jgi:hypothetical protein
LLKSLRGSAFDVRSLLMVMVVVEGALGQGFLQVLRLHPVNRCSIFIHSLINDTIQSYEVILSSNNTLYTNSTHMLGVPHCGSADSFTTTSSQRVTIISELWYGADHIGLVTLRMIQHYKHCIFHYSLHSLRHVSACKLRPSSVGDTIIYKMRNEVEASALR